MDMNFDAQNTVKSEGYYENRPAKISTAESKCKIGIF